MSMPAGFDREEIVARLRDGLSHFEAPVAVDHLAAQLGDYLAELHKWNRTYNLTAVRDPVQMLSRHIYDSLTVLPFVTGRHVADVGTGAGLPGIPLALCCRDKQFTLCDANGKKTRFVQHAVAHLGLRNVSVEHSRVEDFRPPVAFDTVVCRAFSSLRDFVLACSPLVSADGLLVAMKGRHPTAELADLPAGWRLQSSTPVSAPGLEGERHILVLQASRLQ